MLDRLALAARLIPGIAKLNAHKPHNRTTVADRIEAQSRKTPQRPFLLYRDRQQSYGALNARANQVAHWALSQGLSRGDVVALCMENRPEYIPSWAGLAKLGVTAALVNTNLTGRALAHAIETSGARHLIVGEECLAAFAGAAPLLAKPVVPWVVRD